MIFNDIFNNIYVINLKESVNRKIHIENEFKRVGIEKYQFFEATPYDSEEVTNLMKNNLVKKFPTCFRCDKKRCDCENNYLTPFQLGNWCSFINLFNDIIKNDYEFVLICEDDIVFTHQHERIINKLLSKKSFEFYKINMEMPLLIRLGTAFNPDNHNSNANPIFIKNYSLCNPCFAINKRMAIVYLHYLKIIDYHSDIYFHKKIPKNIKGVQYFTMYPYPVYELSFVKEKQKFESTVRPNNQPRRIEYKDFLFLSSNLILNIFLKKLVKNIGLDIPLEKIGYHGNINYFMILNEDYKKKYYFENKIVILDNYHDDIKIIYSHLINKTNIEIYKLYLHKINEKFNMNITFDNGNLLYNTISFYKYYLELLNLENVVKIDINNTDDQQKLLKFYKNENMLNSDIANYNNFKKLLFQDDRIKNLSSEIDNINCISF